MEPKPLRHIGEVDIWPVIPDFRDLVRCSNPRVVSSATNALALVISAGDLLELVVHPRFRIEDECGHLVISESREDDYELRIETFQKGFIWQENWYGPEQADGSREYCQRSVQFEGKQNWRYEVGWGYAPKTVTLYEVLREIKILHECMSLCNVFVQHAQCRAKDARWINQDCLAGIERRLLRLPQRLRTILEQNEYDPSFIYPIDLDEYDIYEDPDQETDESASVEVHFFDPRNGRERGADLWVDEQVCEYAVLPSEAIRHVASLYKVSPNVAAGFIRRPSMIPSKNQRTLHDYWVDVTSLSELLYAFQTQLADLRNALRRIRLESRKLWFGAQGFLVE